MNQYMDQYYWVSGAFDEAIAKLGRAGIIFNQPTVPIGQGMWGQTYHAIYTSWQMPVVVKFTRDKGEMKVAEVVVRLRSTGKSLLGFPKFIYSPFKIGHDVYIIVREPISLLSVKEKRAIEIRLADTLQALEDSAFEASQGHGRAVTKYRQHYLDAVVQLGEVMPDLAQSLHLLASSQKLLVADITIENLGHVQDGRIVLFDYHIYGAKK